MSKYSSLLFSPERYYEIGPFRFPIYKDLVPGEAKRIEEISRKQSKSTYNSVKLAQKIAKDKNISTKEAIGLLSGGGNDDGFLYDYADDLQKLNQESVSAVEQQVAFVTVFMQFRGEAKLPKSKDWEKLSDWTQNDTEEMPSKLMEQIFQLITWEQNGWPKDDNDEGNEPDSGDKES